MAAPAVVQHQLEIVEPADGFTLKLARRPDAIVGEAVLCANALMAAVRKNGWAIRFGTKEDAKEHLYFEAWAFLAAMYRVTPRTVETKYVKYEEARGFECTAEALHIPSGSIISVADSMCLDDEDNWSDRAEYKWQYNAASKKREKTATGNFVAVPLFQLRSMAQTRAQAKALRGPFSWIVAMAGFAPRAAEDMRGDEKGGSGDSGSLGTPPQKADTGSGAPGAAGDVITGAQASRIWGIAHGLNVEKSIVMEILQGHGFTDAKFVTKDKYKAITDAIEANGAQGGAK